MVYGGGRRGHKGRVVRLPPEDSFMRLVIALILPWLAFFIIGRPVSGIVCLILQITLIGWAPAAIWAVYALSQYTTDRKIEDAMRRTGGGA